MTNFFTSYKTAIEEKPNNKQAALSSIESKYTDSFAGKTNYIDINGLFARFVDKVEMNGVVRLNNGYLITTDRMNSYVDVATTASYVSDFRDYLNLYDIPFFQAIAPDVLLEDSDPAIPIGYTMNINDNANKVKVALEEKDVIVLDFREELVLDPNAPLDYYFKGEPHWTVDAAFWAHEKIALQIDKLLQNTYSNFDYFDLDNYIVEQYENNFLGAWGLRTGIFFSGTNPNKLVLPDFPTLFTTNIERFNWHKTGTFYETSVDIERLSSGYDTPFSHNSYGIYPFFGEYSVITNHLVDNGLKIFITRDSFTGPVAPFLALHYKEVHLYDVRNANGGTSERLLQLIRDINPDVVATISATGVLHDVSAFDTLPENIVNGIISYSVNTSSTITLNKSTSLNQVKLINWNGLEENATWTKDASSIQFETDLNTDFILTLDYARKLQEGMTTTILFNKEEVAVLDDYSGVATIMLPKELFVDGIQSIQFNTPTATTPKEVGINEDTRTLGISVRSVTLEPEI